MKQPILLMYHSHNAIYCVYLVAFNICLIFVIGIFGLFALTYSDVPNKLWAIGSSSFHTVVSC
jgi:hypothetical protein